MKTLKSISLAIDIPREVEFIYNKFSGVDFLAFPPINIGEIYKKIFDLRKVISQSEILFDLKQLHQLSVGL